MDFVGLLSNDIESTEFIDASRGKDSARLSDSLRALIAGVSASSVSAGSPLVATEFTAGVLTKLPPLAEIPEALRMEAFRRSGEGRNSIGLPIGLCPSASSGRRSLPSRPPDTWPALGRVLPAEPLPLLRLDTYRCSLNFHLFTAAFHEELVEYFRYVPDQVEMVAIDPLWLSLPKGNLGYM